jgi:acyl-CoA thioesterase-1
MKWIYVASAVWLLAACDRAPVPPPAAAASEAPVGGPERHVVAIGDSLFAGYGLAPGQSYPARLAAALRAAGVNVRIANAGVSGDTSGDNRARIGFVLDAQPQPPDLVLIELGGNDLLRGLPPAQVRGNLDAILTELDRRKLKVVVMGMLAPPNLGGDYAAAFNPVYPALAKRHGDALVPFFLQAVQGKPDLVQADHVHPTAPGIEAIVADTLPTVEKALGGYTRTAVPSRTSQTAASLRISAKGARSVPVSQTCAGLSRSRSNSAARRSGSRCAATSSSSSTGA